MNNGIDKLEFTKKFAVLKLSYVCLLTMFLLVPNFVFCQTKGQINKQQTISSSDKKININHFRVNVIKHSFFSDYKNNTNYEINPYYFFEIEIINQSNLRLKNVEIRGGINLNSEWGVENFLTYYQFDENWLPQSSVVLFLFFKKSGNQSLISVFDHTPKKITCDINIKAHNIDEDFNENIISYDILKDLQAYQIYLGLREMDNKYSDLLQTIRRLSETYSNDLHPQTNKVNFIMKTAQIVKLGVQFGLICTVNAKGQNFKLPEPKDFEVLMGPVTSHDSLMNYVFILRAKKEGKFKINPGIINIDGRDYKSNSVSVEVVKSSVKTSTEEAEEK